MAEAKVTKVTIEKLDTLGKKLAKLKDSKSKLKAELDKVSADETAIQQEYIDLLIQADKDYWEIKGVGKLSLSFRTFFNVKNREKFVAWAKKKGKDYGITLQMIEDNTKIATTGLSELLKDVVTDQKTKDPNVDLEEVLGLGYARNPYITKSKGKTK